MYKPEALLEKEMHKILWEFKIKKKYHLTRTEK